MKIHAVSVLIGLTLLSGCASQIMSAYVGREITSVVAQYGPPTHEYDLPDGTRAFQWERLETHHVPETIIYEEKHSRKRTSGTSTTIGGYVEEELCFYTLYAEPGLAGNWVIVGFEKPRFECE